MAYISQDRSLKRDRSPSPSNGRQRDDGRYDHDYKRTRARDEHERVSVATSRSPQWNGVQRHWQDLTAEERDREWQRYEWDHHHAVIDAGQHRRGGGRDAYDRDAQPPVRSSHDPMDSPSLLSFKRYTQLLRESGSEPAALATGPEATQELWQKYTEYRKAFQARSMKQFWQKHRSDKWFREKYGIESAARQAQVLRRRSGRAGRKKAWLEELHGGKLDKICSDVVSEYIDGGSRLVAFDRFGSQIVLDDAESIAIDAEPNQILIKSIPVDVGREEVEEVLQAEEGFLYLALGEPHPLKRLSRIAWAVFKDGKSTRELESLCAKLSQTSLGGQKLSFETTTRPAQAKLKIAHEVASSLPRLLHDIKQARLLVQHFETDDRETVFLDEADLGECSISASDEIQRRILSQISERGDEDSEGILANLKADAFASAEAGDGAEQSLERVHSEEYRRVARTVLDLHIDLLRQVYHCDYYTATQCDFPEELSRRAPKCLRYVAKDPTTSTDAERSNDKARVWASNVDDRIRLLLGPDDNDIGEFGGINLQQLLLDKAAPYSREDEAEKHRCIVKADGENECGKPFKARIFVQKHVLNKHRDWFSAKMADEIADVRTFNNYVRDPQRTVSAVSSDRADGNGAGRLGSGHLGDRATGHEYGAQSSSYYGSSGVLRMGATQPALDSTDGPGNGVMRMGATTAASIGSQRAQLPPNPRPLDPRATMAPKSYQDLDAGAATGEADLELQY